MRIPHPTPAWLCLVLLLAACSRYDSSIPSAVGDDVTKAIDIISQSIETQTERMQRAFGLIKKHPQPAALRALAAWLEDGDANKRRSAVYAIQMLRWDDARPAMAGLRPLLEHSEAATRGMAAMALASVGDGESFAAFVQLFEQDADPMVRRSAAFALGELDDARALEVLRRELAARTDTTVWDIAKNAVERMTFQQQHRDAEGDTAQVVQGIWLIAGSALHHKERIERALAQIRAADASVRRTVLDQLKDSERQAIRNAALLARVRLGHG